MFYQVIAQNRRKYRDYSLNALNKFDYHDKKNGSPNGCEKSQKNLRLCVFSSVSNQ